MNTQPVLGTSRTLNVPASASTLEMTGRRVLATRYVEATQDAPSDDAPGGVVAANAAVARALTLVAAFCIDASADLAPHAASTPSLVGPTTRP